MYHNPEYALIVEDNDTKHKCKQVKDVINRENLTILDGCPANSPDLNPIENLWEIWDRNVHANHPKNLEELDQYA